MRKSFVMLGLVGALAGAAASAHEAVYTFTLSGLNENPQNASPGTGMGTVTLDLDLFTMRVQASFSGMAGTTTNAHIHCCAAAPANVGVATTTPTFTGFPSGVSSGSYDHTFDMALASSYNAAFITANGGTVSTAFNALKAGMDTGMAYMNIHSSLFAGGEIRGQLAVSPVPEAASPALMAVGLAALAGLATLRRRRSGR